MHKTNSRDALDVDILLVGCGKMGQAILSRLLSPENHYNIRIVESNADAVARIKQNYGDISVYTAPDRVNKDYRPSVILLAVKPQSLDKVLPEYSKIYGIDPLYISIAAGKNINTYKRALGKDVRIIRAMPNTPATIGKGVTALYGSDNITLDDKTVVNAIFRSTGKILWLENESEIDAITAISGSGPAYVFYFMECLIDAAKELGLEEDTARMLVLNTVEGSASLAISALEENGKSSISSLRSDVTSPKGTTEAAIAKLTTYEGKFSSIISEAVRSAYKRSKELAAASSDTQQ